MNDLTMDENPYRAAQAEPIKAEHRPPRFWHFALCIMLLTVVLVAVATGLLPSGHGGVVAFVVFVLIVSVIVAIDTYRNV